MTINNTAGLKIIILLIAISLTASCRSSQDELVWHDFPEHPGYSQEEQLYYLKYFQTGFGKAGSLINDHNKISEDNIEYLIRVAERRLSYKDLNEKSGKELILISAHLTQEVLQPCLSVESCNVSELSYVSNDSLIDSYKRRSRGQKGLCINYTLMNKYIFSGLKARYAALGNYEFIPLTITRRLHAVQGFYDKKTNKIAILCSLTDDIDGKFNSGNHKLNWNSDMPDIYYENNIDFIRIVKRIDDDPEQVIDKFLEMEAKGKYPENYLQYYIGIAYNRLGESRQTNRIFFEILKRDSVFGSAILNLYLN